MKFSRAAVYAAVGITSCLAFAPSSTKSRLNNKVATNSKENTQNAFGSRALASFEAPIAVSLNTALHMAFETDRKSNIFEGPLALTQERDACGVGFVVNTSTGG